MNEPRPNTPTPTVPLSQLKADEATARGVTGSPDTPDFKPRRGLLWGLLFVYVVWIGVMIAWSVSLHRK